MRPRFWLASFTWAAALAVTSCADRQPTAPSDEKRQGESALPVPLPRFDLGGSANLNITAKILDFGDVQIGTGSAQQTVNITNVGGSPVVMSGAGGAPAGNFNGVQDCQGTTLAVGASCHMFFTFNPAVAGPDSSVSIGTWNGQAFSIKLRGNGVAPKLLMTTAAIGFGTVQLGVVSPQQVVNITNVGRASVVMSGVGGAPAGNFNGVQDCQGTTLAVGATCHMFFTFNPATAGPDSSASIGTWNGQSFNIKLRGVGLAPRFRITASAWDFGEVPVGTGSQADTVTITNVGLAAVIMSGAGGAPSGSFNGVQDCQGTVLAVGASCHMFFTFSPTTTGLQTTASIGSWNGQSFNIPLQGTGIPTGTTPDALFRISARALDFGDVRVGIVSSQQTVNITNISPNPVVMSGAGGAPPGNFNGVQDCQGLTLNPGATCHMFFTFNPALPGPDSSASIGSWNGQSFNIKLRGNGVLPRLRITPSALDLGDVQTNTLSRTDTVTITNLDATSIVMSGAGGAPPGNFNGVQDCQGLTLSPGATCHMFFTFNPPTPVADSSSSVGSWNGVGFNIPMRGNGVPPQFLITPAGFDFGRINVNTTSMQASATVTNVGLRSIQVSGAGGALSGDFNAVQDCQGVVLAVGASCHVTYTFSPAVAGPATATSIGSWNGQNYSVPLQGIGVSQLLDLVMDLMPATINLKNQDGVKAALISTANFDATAVVLTSVSMTVNGTTEVAPATRGGTIVSAIRDVNDDGRLDLVITFNTSDLAAAGLSSTATTDSLILHGTTATQSWRAKDPVPPKIQP